MEIRQYTHEDRSKLLDLIRIVYNKDIHEKAIRRFQWQYEENPFNTSVGFIILLLEENNQVLGMLGAFSQKVKVGNENFPAYWLGDFMIHPDFRGRQGIKLATKMMELPYLFMGFPGDHVMNLWLRSGATSFGQLVEYTKNIQPPLVGKMRRKLLSVFRSGAYSHKASYETKIEEIHHFDGRFDSLWKKVSGNYKVIQVRDSVFLNWRFFKCPHLSYRVLTAVKKNELLGYIVLRDEDWSSGRCGLIVDIFVDTSDRPGVKMLLESAIKVLTDRGCSFIKIRVCSHEKILAEILHQYSFSSCPNEAVVFRNNIDKNINTDLESQDCFLTNADSDMDFSV